MHRHLGASEIAEPLGVQLGGAPTSGVVCTVSSTFDWESKEDYDYFLFKLYISLYVFSLLELRLFVVSGMVRSLVRSPIFYYVRLCMCTAYLGKCKTYNLDFESGPFRQPSHIYVSTVTDEVVGFQGLAFCRRFMSPIGVLPVEALACFLSFGSFPSWNLDQPPCWHGVFAKWR